MKSTGNLKRHETQHKVLASNGKCFIMIDKKLKTKSKKMNKCDPCNQLFSNKSNLNRHNDVKHVYNRDDIQSEGNTIFFKTGFFSFDPEIVGSREDVSFPCDQCKESFTTKTSLESHKRKVHQEKE